MSLPTQGEARSRQTAYLATEHWWRSRVEQVRRIVQSRVDVQKDNRTLVIELQSVANMLDAILVAREINERHGL